MPFLLQANPNTCVYWTFIACGGCRLHILLRTAQSRVQRITRMLLFQSTRQNGLSVDTTFVWLWMHEPHVSSRDHQLYLNFTLKLQNDAILKYMFFIHSFRLYLLLASQSAEKEKSLRMSFAEACLRGDALLHCKPLRPNCSCVNSGR